MFPYVFLINIIWKYLFPEYLVQTQQYLSLLYESEMFEDC